MGRIEIQIQVASWRGGAIASTPGQCSTYRQLLSPSPRSATVSGWSAPAYRRCGRGDVLFILLGAGPGVWIPALPSSPCGQILGPESIEPAGGSFSRRSKQLSVWKREARSRCGASQWHRWHPASGGRPGAPEAGSISVQDWPATDTQEDAPCQPGQVCSLFPLFAGCRAVSAWPPTSSSSVVPRGAVIEPMSISAPSYCSSITPSARTGWCPAGASAGSRQLALPVSKRASVPGQRTA